ncbi:MAG: hypothetical protein ACOYBO_01060 [Azonexus sp.]
MLDHYLSPRARLSLRAHRNQQAKAQPALKNFNIYQADPVGFSREVLHRDLTPGQVGILEAVRDHKITVVKSANAVGKTYGAASVALWFLRVFEQSKVISAAAPPLENLERLLWGEIDKTLLDHADVFEGARRGYLEIGLGPDWWLTGVAIPTSGTSAQREAKFSGKHAPYLLFIVDEADAVPDEVYRGIESCMSGGHVRLLVLFNPREQSGPVYRMIKSGAHTIELDAFGHPNVISGRDEVPGAVSREITVERIHKWSRPATDGDRINPSDRDWFQVPDYLDGAMVRLDDGTESPALIGSQWRQVTNPALSYMVLARYPGQSETQLISRSWVEAAVQRWLLWRQMHGDNPPENIRPLHGQDVAEFGNDLNVACFRYGGWVAPFESWGGVDTLVTSDRAAERAKERNARESFIDATGLGSGVAPGMRRWWSKNGYPGVATAVKVANSPTVEVEDGKFGLLRDQLWWLCREWLRKDTSAMLPPDERLADELCTPKYHVRNGVIKVTDKDAMRTSLHRSPDYADSLCLTFAPSGSNYLEYMKAMVDNADQS